MYTRPEDREDQHCQTNYNEYNSQPNKSIRISVIKNIALQCRYIQAPRHPAVT